MKEERSAGAGKRGVILIILFFFAMIMGAGPGIYLVNGRGPFLGVPVIYAWVVFWFAIQAGTVVIAFKTIWNK